MKISARAKALAEETSAAYSYDRYRSWAAVAEALVSAGYTDDECESIMRSKWTRWASDRAGIEYGKTPGRAITDYINAMIASQGEESVKRQIAELVAGTIMRPRE